MKVADLFLRFSTLQLTLTVSLALHAAVLSVRFIVPEGFNRVFQDTPLEVVLVNARTNERAEQAKAIAQFSMAGGGDAEKGRASSTANTTAINSENAATPHRECSCSARKCRSTSFSSCARCGVAT